MGDRLKKRGDIWYAWVPDGRGGLHLRTTRCTDKAAARVIQAQLERDGVDPARAAANQTTLQRVLDDYEASRRRLKRAEGTMHHVRVKSGHLLRLLPTLARDVQHSTLEAFIDKRQAEGAATTTVKKELRVFGASWKLARRNKLVLVSLDELMPELEDDYEPRKRTLTIEELYGVCLGLPRARAAIVAFIVATSAEWATIARAERVDVAADVSMCHVRGSKRKTRNRMVPIVSDVQRSLLAFAVRNADGVEGKLFTPWSNVRRDLHAACELAHIEPCSPNDLRRTFGTWLRAAGVEPQLIGAAMGHVDSRMVERVYGRITPDALAKLLEQRLQPARLMSATTTKSEPNNEQRDGEEPPQPEEMAGLAGAQRRNRTADTGIFNPSESTTNTEESDCTREACPPNGRRPYAVATFPGSPRSDSADDTGMGFRPLPPDVQTEVAGLLGEAFAHVFDGEAGRVAVLAPLARAAALVDGVSASAVGGAS